MYAAVRPALRSASIARPQARFINRRRYPLRRRARSFHSSGHLSQNSNPPPSPGNTPAETNGTNKKAREPTAAAAAAAERAEAGVAPEDPEVLAQKLQRSKEMTRRYSSALRRTQRRNRAAQDLPPIHIPDWFFQKRVRLREDTRKRPKRRDCALSIKHVESGEHGVCSIPFLTYSTGIESMSDLVRAMWKKDLSQEQITRFAQEFARRMGRENDPKVIEALRKGEDPDLRALPKAQQEEDVARSRGSTDYKQHFTSAVCEGLKMFAVKESDEKESEAIERSRRSEKIISDGKRISPLLLAEIRATIVASLSALQPAINDSFPSSKTNLILHSPSEDHEPFLQNVVQSLAAEVGADLVTLNAQDLGLLAGDYLGEGTEPSPRSIRSLAYETYRSHSDIESDVEDLGDLDHIIAEDQDPHTDGETPRLPYSARVAIYNVMPVLKGLNALKGTAQNLQGGLPSFGQEESITVSSSSPTTRTQSPGEIQLEDLKLGALLEALIDSTELKRTRQAGDTATQDASSSNPPQQTVNQGKPKFFDFSMNQSEGTELDFSASLPISAKPALAFTVNPGPASRRPHVPRRPKIIHVSDIKELNGTQHGSRIMQKLQDIVRKQRHAGESIMILGTTCSSDLIPDLSGHGLYSLQSEDETGMFRTIVAPVATTERNRDNDEDQAVSAIKRKLIESSSSPVQKRKFRSINLRHIQDMLRNLNPTASIDIANVQVSEDKLRSFGTIFPEYYFWRAMTYDEVHRVALTSLGLHFLDQSNPHLSWAHVALAMGLLRASDDDKYAYFKYKRSIPKRSLKKQFLDQMTRDQESWRLEPLRNPHGLSGNSAKTAQDAGRQTLLDRIAAKATKHEKALMQGIANPEQIKTTFDHVHVPRETIDGIRTLTSLSLLRPDAFNYGVLATEKISGALLYGPPGTGKTLLAKAVAKESGSMVLEVSGSQIMDKYVGEGEKNVTAIFSLARKLSPCIVFLDEADAIFGSRDSSRERTAHRDILNQFLKEWDGLNDLSVFVMVATNRPFDMDDAVIRRLPRRLLVDLPTEEDRKKILGIHLRGEQLDESIDLADLARRTPFYSGSDLKNVAVFAALACVQEENEKAAIAAAKAAAKAAAEAAQSESREAAGESSNTNSEAQPEHPPTLVQGQKYDFPERRTLHQRHFDKALQEVSASISENMSSLNAIKKFDEQYGDRKGRRKKTPFGLGVKPATEKDARVRT